MRIGHGRRDAAAARAAFEPLAKSLGLSLDEAARGVLALADEHMVQALRVISVEKGEDPRDYALFAFGGAGGLHVCALAERLGVTRALFPANAGVLSALGMLAAPRARNLSRTHVAALASVDARALEPPFAALAAQGLAELASEGVDAGACRTTRALDLRYAGQSYAIEVAWDGAADRAAEAFHAAHAARYGHRLDLPVELVTLRVRVEAPAPTLKMGSESVDSDPVFGPVALATADATLWVAAGWTAVPDAFGNWVLSRQA